MEWDARIRGAVGLHRGVADALGRRIVDAPIGCRSQLLDRARRHGWCADEWSTVVPLLHDVDAPALVPIDTALGHASADLVRAVDGVAALEAEGAVAARLAALYRSWRDEASEIADAPYLHTVARMLVELAAGPTA